jgi:hypothetical protein
MRKAARRTIIPAKKLFWREKSRWQRRLPALGRFVETRQTTKFTYLMKAGC